VGAQAPALLNLNPEPAFPRNSLRDRPKATPADPLPV
jgi:hypothetical protein